MKTLFFTFLLLSMTLMISCVDKRSNESSEITGHVDSAFDGPKIELPDYVPPGLNIIVTRINNGDILFTYRNGIFTSGRDTNGQVFHINTGDRINVNLTGSINKRKPTSPLTFRTDITKLGNNLQTSSQRFTSNNFNVDIVAPGKVDVIAVAFDGQFSETRYPFHFYVACAPNQIFNTVASPATNNNYVTPNTFFNFFDFNVASLRRSNPLAGNSYTYVLDFNGDGMDDTNSIEVPTGTITEYVIYRGSRNVKVKIKDEICQVEKEVIITGLNFGSTECQPVNIPWEDGLLDLANPISSACNAGLIPARYFVQGEIQEIDHNLVPMDSNPQQIMTVDDPALAFTSPERHERVFVKCNLEFANMNVTTGYAQNGSLMVEGVNTYNDLGIAGKKIHGINLQFDNIPASVFSAGAGSINSFTSESPKGILFSNAQYLTDEGPDQIGLSQKIYTKNGDCEFQLVFVPLGPGTCIGASAGWASNIYGTYSCNSLKTPADEFINITKGEFYCISGGDVPCGVGGGGGGGPQRGY